LSDDLIEELEIEACGLDAKITQLLKWGALLLQELESCTVRKNQVTLQIKTLTGEEEPLDTWRGKKKEMILAAIEKYDGNHTLAAKELGMSTRNVRWHLRRIKDEHDLREMHQMSPADASETTHANPTGKARAAGPGGGKDSHNGVRARLVVATDRQGA
jgi:hypothetical protein